MCVCFIVHRFGLTSTDSEGGVIVLRAGPAACVAASSLVYIREHELQPSPLGHEEPAFGKVKLIRMQPMDFFALFQNGILAPKL